MEKICTFFGHRRMQIDLEKLQEAIHIVIAHFHVTQFWCGGYGDFDHCAAEMVHRTKSNYPDIRLVRILAYLPGKTDRIPEIYDASIYPEGLETIPQRFAISKRNQWMVDHSDVFIFAVDLQTGGAYQAYQRAKRQGKPIISIGML